ncbi:DNA polymerase III subunit alpha [Oceanospirillaceae bacterium]|jgi:DNA polymerase-3 subunit alpha|nr:DNA polymerase III subunit alpha [Oceanospirillaceae bacterium]MBT4997488.1 DNA polymerase III subunit alpha [Oceanospirillaceae bacterium]MBT5629681.1 DNA polymerase III subunit alpha [Oceanospirillaceae bacterium]MBT6101137.1 DNA polymerase III subunit alpha [Oceanospirillaceae bacterium]MDB0065003.1 DNA polymerase III subunit alpha [Oceanospirillaceae bacterium]
MTQAVPFVHLRMHSEFSLIDSMIRIKPLMKALQAEQMPAIALTDQSTMSGMIKFYKAAQSAGIKPICGCDVFIAETTEADATISRMTLLAMDSKGYLNLTELVSRSFQEGQIDGKAIIQKQWLADKSEGLIVLSGAAEGEIGRALINRGVAEAEQILRYWIGLFGDRFYLEVQRTGRQYDEDCLHLSAQLAQLAKVPIVATNDVMFVSAEDFEAHETRVCINQSMTLDDPRRLKAYSNQQYLRSAEEMQALFVDLPSALENSVQIAKRCNLDIQLGHYSLPNFPVPDGLTMDEFFGKVSRDGLEKRLKVILDATDPKYQAQRKIFDDRLEFELNIICQMGFPGYFLIVMDFIHWAKDNDIPVGPGRGSGAGSLVAYVLEITDLDPLKYDLLFERFLNPERVSMPDFDIDFCMDNRDRVIEYVSQTYGKDAVSQIITFGTMAAKAVVRDVARVQGKPFGLADKLSKLIPFEVGITLSKAVEQENTLREFIENNDEVQEIMDMAYQLEGLTRNVGKHAGGVVIAPTKLTDFSPLYCDADGSGLVTQYDKNDVEDAGLVKFDFLGLKTLTVVDWAMGMINERRQAKGEEAIAIETIPLADEPVYKLLQGAETTGVFQLESRGMKDLIKRQLPSNFEDIIALVALFRPGPLQSGMVDDFINRKHGRAQLAWPHEDYQLDSLRPVLEPTYGIILYQEQVMQIAQVMAGYSLGEADMLRRAMGKKKPEEMAKQRSGFLAGSVANGIDEGLAGNIFDLVEKFAGYGFNKSHSAAYALVAYQTAWLKHHYPAEFMAAVLSADMQNIDKIVIFVEECRRMELPLNLPNVNESHYKFTVNSANQVVYGLGAVKGVGEGPVAAIIEARETSGDFKDLFDFCKRVGSKKINKRVLEALVASGALDNLVPNKERSVLYSAIPDAVQSADQSERNSDAGMMDLFGEIAATADDAASLELAYERHITTRSLTLKQRLKGEKDTLGLYVTGHPIDSYDHELGRFLRCRLDQLMAKKDKQWIAGLVVASRTMKTKRGKTIAFLTLDDRRARIDVALFGDTYEKYRELLQTDRLLIVEGEVSEDDYSGGLKVSAQQILTMPQARTVFSKGLRLSIAPDFAQGKGLQQLLGILSPHQVYGDKPAAKLELQYENSVGRGVIRCASPWRLEVGDDMLQELVYLLGAHAVKMRYRKL